MLIAGVDPGLTTGVCLIRPPTELVFADQGTAYPVADFIRRYRPDVVVIEDFKPQPGLPDYAPLPAPQVIGSVEEVGKAEHIRVVRQTPAMKFRVPTRLLRVAGLWTDKPHANDAISHALYYAWFTLGYEKDPRVQEIIRRYIKEVTRYYTDEEVESIRQRARQKAVELVRKLAGKEEHV